MKLPRDLSGQKVIKALKRLGFEEDRQVGSHVRLSKGALHVTVPSHRVIAPKTLQSILRQSQVTATDLMREL